MCCSNASLLDPMLTALSISENLHELETATMSCAVNPSLQCDVLLTRGPPNIRFMELGILTTYIDNQEVGIEIVRAISRGTPHIAERRLSNVRRFILDRTIWKTRELSS